MCAMLTLMLLVFVFKGCEKSAEPDLHDYPNYTSFMDVPGVTEDEIREIENLREQIDSFIYGMPLSTEAFEGVDGEITGYAALLCEWLTELFGIPFKPVLYEWLDLLAGLGTGEIAFSGELTATEERMNVYHMTDAIASRPLKYFCLADSKPIAEIAKIRTLRCGFIEGTSTIDTVSSELEPGTFEVILLSDVSLVYGALKSGKIDAFYYSATAEVNFIGYSDLITLNFYPLIYRPVSLATQNPALQPIISVVEKVLENGGIRYLTTLYNKGQQEYLTYKLYTQLTEEERAYIKSRPVVPVGVDPGNYPGCFYDKREKEWGGIYLDMLEEVSQLTGLTFKRVNEEHTEWPVIYQMLLSGEAAVVPDLTHTEDREKLFLWPDTVEMTDYYALISKSDYRDIKVNEVLYVKVGMGKDTAYSAIFRKWFPNHMNTIEYESMEEAFSALQRGEVDMVMANQKRLLYLTHYLELPGYKVNVVFDQALDTKFGFNKDETILCSIADKALRLVDRKSISDQWMRKTYDYRIRLAEARLPWLIGVAALLVAVLILTMVLLHIRRGNEKRLTRLVDERTSELEAKTSMLNTIFDSAPSLLFCMDLDLKYLRVNRSMEKHFNFLEKDVIGRNDREVLNVPEDVLREIEERNLIVINENTVNKVEEYVPSRDGRDVYFETTKVPLWQNGNMIGLLGIAHDITQRKIMEEDARSASRSKSAFLAKMSHELRTPLNVIIGLTDLTLEEDSLSDYVRKNLISVGNAGSTLLNIVNDILDVSKIESGKMTLTPVEYHMPSLLNDTIILLNTYIGEKPIDFKLNISGNLPGMLYGDELRVKQILNNLLSNAVKYTRAGTVELSVECELDGKDVWMDITVTDTGIGIRKEDLKELFNEYYQADTRTNRRTEGTGLGLSITLKMAEMMDGTVSVESEYGKGSTFRVRLRQGFVSDIKIGEAIAKNLRSFKYSDTKRQTSNRLVRVDLSQAKVLVVDDMQNNLDVAAGLMRKYKMQVDCVSSGQAAVDRIYNGTLVYNAVFMDHMMPGMDGIEAANAIRALETEYARNVPIIALTANAIAGTEQQFYDNGFQDFLSKPIDIMQLDAILKKWVGSQIKKKPADTTELFLEDHVMTINIPGVDAKKGLSLYGGDLDIYLSVLRSYASNTSETLIKLCGVTRETLPECVINAHGLKGTSANICAEQVRVAAAELESTARNGDLIKSLTLLEPLLKDAEYLVENINAWFEVYDGKNEKPRMKFPDRKILTELKQSCETYDISGIDKAMDELESMRYDMGSDLVAWLRGKIDIMELDEVIARLSEENL